MAPKHERSDAGSSDLPNRSRKVLPWSEKVNVLDLIKSYAVDAKIYSKNEFSICEIVRRKKKYTDCQQTHERMLNIINH